MVLQPECQLSTGSVVIAEGLDPDGIEAARSVWVIQVLGLATQNFPVENYRWIKVGRGSSQLNKWFI